VRFQVLTAASMMIEDNSEQITWSCMWHLHSYIEVTAALVRVFVVIPEYIVQFIRNHQCLRDHFCPHHQGIGFWLVLMGCWLQILARTTPVERCFVIFLSSSSLISWQYLKIGYGFVLFTPLNGSDNECGHLISNNCCSWDRMIVGSYLQSIHVKSVQYTQNIAYEGP
jgi:hypothetical protein